jgi:hypothetical protein
MDIIYFKPITFALTSDTYLCTNHHYGHSIGFLLSCPGNQVFQYLYQKAKLIFNKTNYQSIGANLLNKENAIMENIDPDYINIPMDFVYPYDAVHIPEIFTERSYQFYPEKFTENTIGLHWYAGHQMAGEIINLINAQTYKNFNIVLSKAIGLAMEGHDANASAN